MVFFLVLGLVSVYGQSLPLKHRLQAHELHYAAHRGAHQENPENSLASIRNAIVAGATVVEVDVRATKDGVLILMHDKTVDRTTSGKGKVTDLTFAEIQQLYLRETPHGVVGQHRVPTLKEALECSKGHIIVDLDFKEERAGFSAKTYALITELAMEDEVLFFLYDYRDMELLHTLNPTITLFPRARNKKDLEEIVRSKRTYIAHIDDSFTDVDYLLSLRNNDFYLWINTLGDFDDQAEINGLDVYRSFLSSYPFVRIIQTDMPYLWKNLLRN